MTPEERLIDFVTTTTTEQLPREVLEKAVHCLLDAVSLARAARQHPVVVAAASLAEGTGPATLWTDGTTAGALHAAFVNGTATHAHFQDDTDMSTWGHPASIVPPAVIAAAQASGADLDAVLRGLVVGYSAMSWLGAREEISHALVRRGFRGSPVLGALAAAVAAAAVLGLDARQALSALGIAADTTGGVLEPVGAGAQDWRLQNGFAAQRGLAGGLLARAGVEGPELPLTGPKGFAAAFVDGVEPAQWQEDPDPAAILGVWFKPYPILGDNMAPAVAASTLTGQADASVTRVTIEMNASFAAYPGTQFAGPFVRTEQMIASTAFGVASVLVHGEFGFDQYPRLIEDAAVLDLVARTQIVPREDFGYLDGAVRLEFEDGSDVSARTQDAPPTRFFRDRAETTAVLAQRGDTDIQRLAETLFAAVDSGTWPQTAELFSAEGASHD